jgi:hypothetical protein
MIMVKRVSRMGSFVDADEAFEAWTSGDLRRMLAARSLSTNPIDRHFLLQGMIKEAYRRRTDREMRRICIETGLMHLAEFSTIARALKRDMGGSLPESVHSRGWPQQWPKTVASTKLFVSAKRRHAWAPTMALGTVIVGEAKNSGRSNPSRRKWTGAYTSQQVRESGQLD